MRKTLHKYFVPHYGNNFHPHILHTKRAIFYASVFGAAKAILVAFVFFLPAEVYVLPDVLAEEQRQIMELTNKFRAEKLIYPLTDSGLLERSSQAKADDMSMNSYFSHTFKSKNVGDWLESVDYNYEFAGENLAVGFSSANEILEAWKASPTHLANLIDTDFTEFGVGLAGGVYEGYPSVFVAQHFAKPQKEIAEKEDKMIGPISSVLGMKEDNSTSTLESEEQIEESTIVSSPVVGANGPTPVEKYIYAKNFFKPITRIFDVSEKIYLGAMIFFMIVLGINIFVEIKKQHPHVIMQTTGLIWLLFLFWKF